MEKLSPIEIDVARTIISQGLVKAAESLSFFMKETISLHEFEDENQFSIPHLEISKKGESNIQLLITKVIGELKGVCCLIFSEAKTP